MKRIFIAINLSEEIKAKLGSLQDELVQYMPNINWIKPENIHLTLVFLGAIKYQKLQKAIEITKEIVAGIHSFNLVLKGLGVFPEARRPRIIWVGVWGDSILKNLNQAFYRRLSLENFVLDDRTFTPHITIGRIKDKKPSKESLFFAINKFKNTEFGKIEIESIEVMESQLRQSGPIYKIVEENKLKVKK